MTQPTDPFMSNYRPGTGYDSVYAGAGSPGQVPGQVGDFGSAFNGAYGNVNPLSIGMDPAEAEAMRQAGMQSAGQLGGYANSQAGVAQGLTGYGGMTNQIGNTIGRIGQTAQGLQGVQGQMAGTQDLLQQEAMGGGPNPADWQMQAGLDAAQALARSQAASARGNFGLAGAQARAAATNAQTNQSLVSQAEMQRMQQQLAAQQQLQAQQQAQVQAASALGGLQAGQLAGQNAQLSALGLQGNLYGSAGNTQNQQAQAYLNAAGLAGTNAYQQGQLGAENAKTNLEGQEFNVKQGDEFLGGIMGMGSSLGSMAAMGG